MASMSFLTLDAAYQHALKQVLYKPEYECAPRGLLIREALNFSFEVIGPTNKVPIVTANTERNAVIAKYTADEISLYDSLTRSAEDYASASSFWRKIKNPDGTINSAYGWLIFGRKVCGNQAYEAGVPARTPWEWALQSLVADKDSRQSILHFSTPDFCWVGNKDFTCTLTIQFFIRDEKLHAILNMRSNDVVLGLVYDCVWFSSLMHRMVDDLKPTYPNLTVGRYVHNAGSMHIYSKNFEIAESMLYK